MLQEGRRRLLQLVLEAATIGTSGCYKRQYGLLQAGGGATFSQRRSYQRLEVMLRAADGGATYEAHAGGCDVVGVAGTLVCVAFMSREFFLWSGVLCRNRWKKYLLY
jgi:hypothetical protein